MRRITIPARVVKLALSDIGGGTAVEFPVQVDWPELRLTDDQIIANAVAFASGQAPPFPDHQIFSVRLERVAP